MTRPDAPSSATASGGQPPRSGPGRNTQVTVLAVLLAVALVIIAMLLMRQPAQQAGPAPAATPAAGQQAPSQQPTQQQTVKDTARRKEGDPLARGKVDAPVVMIEYADYACPFCAKWSLETEPVLQKYVEEGTLRFEWHDLVIFGDKSLKAAHAARAAGEQGKFWEYKKALFTASPASGHPDLTDDKLRTFAQQAGVPDLDRWAKDMTSAQVTQATAAETSTAQQLGASSTPVFIINGKPLVGAQPTEAFVQAIEQAKAAAKK